MTSARKIRINHHFRTFISKAQPEFGIGPARDGLAYGDVRSHQRKPHVSCFSPHRTLPLNQLPVDTFHQHRKDRKKEDQADRKAYKDQRREKKREAR